MVPSKNQNKEVELDSRQLSVMDRYLCEINDSRLLTAEEEKELALRIEAGDEDARNQLVEANLRLVVNIARIFSGRGWAMEDLIEEGNLGLIRAANNYRLSEGTRFSTYASYWIQQAIHRAIINNSKLIRLPAYMVEIISKWRRATVLLEEELHRPPYSEEIARRIGLPKKRMALTLKALNAYKVAPSPDNADGYGLDATIVDDREQSPDDILMERNLLEKIHEELHKLSERELQVLVLRFGLEDGREHTLTEVGNSLKITRERVRQISIDAIEKLSWKLK
ncbi:MAG: RNA polymerase sigma factor RpoD/SigA [Planctomycetia bacterium]|nr:RNA polymerase sigma factor RpoD/SigA [Planctomycetia bacterium]